MDGQNQSVQASPDSDEEDLPEDEEPKEPQEPEWFSTTDGVKPTTRDK